MLSGFKKSDKLTPTSKSIVYGNAYSALSTPTRDHDIFNGWFTAQTGGADVGAYTRCKMTQCHMELQMNVISHVTGSKINVYIKNRVL